MSLTGRRLATRDDVARLAGTSTAVVSYVVNNGPRNVSPATRARVLAAIDELDYTPNAVARALRAADTRTLGLIVPNIDNPFFAELAQALETRAFELGRVLLLGNSNENAEREDAYLRNFLERQVDGIVLIGVADRTPPASTRATGCRVVLLDRPASDADAEYVCIDNTNAAREGVEHLIGHGHRRIACIAGPEGQRVASDRQLGWVAAMQDAGLHADPDLTRRAAFSVDGGVAAASSLFAEVGPTALFVSSDSQAQGTLAVAHRLGIRIPEDIAIVSFDGTRQTTYSDPALSVIEQPLREMATTVVDHLAGPSSAPRLQKVLGHMLSVRRSCGCAYDPWSHQGSLASDPDHLPVPEQKDEVDTDE